MKFLINTSGKPIETVYQVCFEFIKGYTFQLDKEADKTYILFPSSVVLKKADFNFVKDNYVYRQYLASFQSKVLPLIEENLRGLDG